MTHPPSIGFSFPQTHPPYFRFGNNIYKVFRLLLLLYRVKVVSIVIINMINCLDCWANVLNAYSFYKE